MTCPAEFICTTSLDRNRLWFVVGRHCRTLSEVSPSLLSSGKQPAAATLQRGGASDRRFRVQELTSARM